MKYFLIAFFLIFTNIITARAISDTIHTQFNILLAEHEDEWVFVYERKYLNLKLKEIHKEHSASMDTFLIWLFKDLNQHDASKNQILFHIHGMWGGQNRNFKRAYKLLNRFYLESEESDISHIVSLKWPGNDMEYKKNKKRIDDISALTKDMLLDLLLRFKLYQYFFSNNKSHVDLIAHSLGNELLSEVFAHFSSSEKEYRVFDQIILAASDNEIDVFEKGGTLDGLHSIANGVHVYYSERDLTLGVSNNLNKRDRLGRHGPSEETQFHPALHFINVKEIKDEVNLPDLMTGHSYYRASPLVITDIVNALKGNSKSHDSLRKKVQADQNKFIIEKIKDN